MRARVLIRAAALAAAALALTGTQLTSASATDDLATARAATAPYHDIAKATGFGLLTDAAGIACIDMPGMGAMGDHYVDGARVGDPSINAATPEALVYEPTSNGRLRLVALEYVVLQADWDATHASRPSLFGQTFALTESPNRFGLPAFYSLHAWVWKHNPAGTFAPFNPDVSCANA